MTATFFEYLGWVSLSPNLKESFNKTLQDAEQNRHQNVEIEHLLYALVDDPEGAITLMQMGVDRDSLRDDVARHLDEIPAGGKIGLEDLQPTRELKKLMAKASDLADKEHDDLIDGGDVVRALAQFETSNSLSFHVPQKNRKPAASRPARKSRRRASQQTRPESSPSQAEKKTMDQNYNPPALNELNVDMDPIKASIKAIMARRRDAEEVLYECEWYHLFKSLNMIDDALDGEAQTHRAKLLARAEAELAERPRCRKAFLYVRHLDKELARLQGIVNFDWTGEITPDEAVNELSRMRSMPDTERPGLNHHTPSQPQSDIGKYLFDVKVQESEVLALEQKLLRLDRTAGTSKSRLKELEGHLESHETHSKKRENVIGELERYLRSEMQLSDARDQRITELESELNDTRTVSSSQVSKTSHLEQELASFKEHAGNREMLISELETKLKNERHTAGAHEQQVHELTSMLDTEKKRAQTHDTMVADLQKTYEEEKSRAHTHAQQVQNLENDLKSRLSQLNTREEHIKSLQENLSAKEQQMQAKEHHILAREEHVKKLEADLSVHQDKRLRYKREISTLQSSYKEEIGSLQSNHQAEMKKLARNMEDVHAESQLQQLEEVEALRGQLASMEHQLANQEAVYSEERVELANNIDHIRQEIEDSENLIEIIRSNGNYRIQAHHGEAQVKSIRRRTIPLAAKPRNN